MPGEVRFKPLRVFLSYSYDSAEHVERVLALAKRLRDWGLDAWIDQYDPEPEDGWPRWMVDEIEKADRVLAICTETYRRRFEGREREGGHGVDWEGTILTDELYRRRRGFVVPVVFARVDIDHIPKALRRFTHHVVDGESGYLRLYRALTGQPAVPAPPIGTPKALDSQARRSTSAQVGSSQPQTFLGTEQPNESIRQPISARRLCAGKRYLGNTNTKEVHDLDNEQTQCQIDEVRAEHIVCFATLQAALDAGYDRCHWCLCASRR